MSGLQGVGSILDDLHIIGSNNETRFRNLEGALERMRSMGNSYRWKPSLEYFAFVVAREGIHPSPSTV